MISNAYLIQYSCKSTIVSNNPFLIFVMSSVKLHMKILIFSSNANKNDKYCQTNHADFLFLSWLPCVLKNGTYKRTRPLLIQSNYFYRPFAFAVCYCSCATLTSVVFLSTRGHYKPKHMISSVALCSAGLSPWLAGCVFLYTHEENKKRRNVGRTFPLTQERSMCKR